MPPSPLLTSSSSSYDVTNQLESLLLPLQSKSKSTPPTLPHQEPLSLSLIAPPPPPPPMDPPPPHSHSSSSSTSFPILAISILGILATAILLLSYYLFIIKCCLNWRLRRSPFLPFRSPTLRRPHRPAVDPVRPAHAPRGLDDSAIRSIPTLRYTRTKTNNSTTTKPVECSVCLAEFEDQELLRVLPGCGHSFHIDCVDTWLQSSANCPLCRFDVSRVPIHNYRPLPVVSQVAVAAAADISAAAPPPPTTPKASRKFWQAASMGDECIDISSREKDESFAVQPIRRSFSMDSSSNDRALFLSVQDVLQQNCRELVHDARRGEGSCSGGDGSGSNACGRIRRSFFSFGRSSRSATAVLPVQSDLC